MCSFDGGIRGEFPMSGKQHSRPAQWTPPPASEFDHRMTSVCVQLLSRKHNPFGSQEKTNDALDAMRYNPQVLRRPCSPRKQAAAIPCQLLGGSGTQFDRRYATIVPSSAAMPTGTQSDKRYATIAPSSAALPSHQIQVHRAHRGTSIHQARSCERCPR